MKNVGWKVSINCLIYAHKQTKTLSGGIFNSPVWLLSEEKGEEGRKSMEYVLELKNIYKSFPGVKVLEDVTLQVRPGEVHALMGENGAGKSTLFNAICGNFLLDEGSVILDGKNISYLPEHQRSASIGRLFQDPMKGAAPNLTIEENLALAYSKNTKGLFRFAITKKDREMFREALKRFDMGLEDRMATKIGLLSGGQRQVVTLLMSTIVTPKLLLLDEHTAALDPATAEKVMAITNDIVRERNLTTLMITHNMGQALTTGSRTIMLDSGAIIFDIKEEEREHMTVSDLLDMYSEKKKEEFDNDRILLN